MHIQSKNTSHNVCDESQCRASLDCSHTVQTSRGPLSAVSQHNRWNRTRPEVELPISSKERVDVRGTKFRPAFYGKPLPRPPTNFSLSLFSNFQPILLKLEVGSKSDIVRPSKWSGNEDSIPLTLRQAFRDLSRLVWAPVTAHLLISLPTPLTSALLLSSN